MTRFLGTSLTIFFVLIIACAVILVGAMLSAICGAIVAEIFSFNFSFGFMAVSIANLFAFITLTLLFAKRNYGSYDSVTLAAAYPIIAMACFIVYSLFSFIIAMVLSAIASDTMVSPILPGAIGIGMIFLIALLIRSGIDKSLPRPTKQVEAMPVLLANDEDFSSCGLYEPPRFF